MAEEIAEKKKAGAKELAYSILIAVGLALIIRTGVVQAYYIPSGSMEDSLLVGDYLFANKFIYGAPLDIPFTDINFGRLPGLRDPQPGDVVIFRSPEDSSRDLIKRCVALGGQTIEIVDKVLYVNGKPFANPAGTKFTDDERGFIPQTLSTRDNFGPYVVPQDRYFMMGDNRDNSHDSRIMGAIPASLIKGKAMILWWSWADDSGGPYYSGPASLPKVLGSYIARLPGRVRYERLGDIIL